MCYGRLDAGSVSQTPGADSPESHLLVHVTSSLSSSSDPTSMWRTNRIRQSGFLWMGLPTPTRPRTDGRASACLHAHNLDFIKMTLRTFWNRKHVGGGHREDVTTSWPSRRTQAVKVPHPFPTFEGASAHHSTARAVPRMQPWESELVLRPPSVDIYSSVDPKTGLMSKSPCLLKLSPANLECLTLSLVSLCPPCMGTSLQTNKTIIQQFLSIHFRWSSVPLPDWPLA